MIPQLSAGEQPEIPRELGTSDRSSTTGSMSVDALKESINLRQLLVSLQ